MLQWIRQYQLSHDRVVITTKPSTYLFNPHFIAPSVVHRERHWQIVFFVIFLKYNNHMNYEGFFHILVVTLVSTNGWLIFWIWDLYHASVHHKYCSIKTIHAYTTIMHFQVVYNRIKFPTISHTAWPFTVSNNIFQTRFSLPLQGKRCRKTYIWDRNCNWKDVETAYKRCCCLWHWRWWRTVWFRTWRCLF